MRCLGDGNVSTKFICVPYIYYTHSLKDILYNFKNNFMHEAKFHVVKFSICDVIFALKNIWSGGIGFRILD